MVAALPFFVIMMNVRRRCLHVGPAFTSSSRNSGDRPQRRCLRRGHASHSFDGSSGSISSTRYPSLNFDAAHGPVQLLRKEPPVWLVNNFLTAEDCNALIEEGREGLRPEKIYEGSFVVFDEERLQPLAIAAATLCAFVSWVFHGDAFAAMTAFALAIVSVACLKETVRWYSETVAAAGGQGGARFTGSKWQLGPPFPGGPAEGARERLLEGVRQLCGLPGIQWMEPPFLTRYKFGEGQAAHLDSRERPKPGAEAEEVAAFERIGGQRVVQCLVYLNDVDMETCGGATSFLHEALAGLRVQPVAGSALVFCTAFANGDEDLRMVHCAEPLHGSKEVEKWIVPLWALERKHHDWHQWEHHAVQSC